MGCRASPLHQSFCIEILGGDEANGADLGSCAGFQGVAAYRLAGGPQGSPEPHVVFCPDPRFLHFFRMNWEVGAGEERENLWGRRPSAYCDGLDDTEPTV